MSKIRYSKDVDILLMEISDKPIDYAEEAGNVIIHFSKNDQPVLIEIQGAKNFLLYSMQSILKEKELILP